MFASIKKRIAAETGKDVSELMPYLTERLSGSRQSSITSLTSSTHDEVGTSKADGNHNEQSKKQQKLSDAEKLEISNLKETIKFLENQNQKLLNHQESLDQLDVLQSQELSKIKHLLLLKDQEVQQLNLQISNNNKIIEELTEENHKLKDKEHQFHNIQEEFETLKHSTNRELNSLNTEIKRITEEKKHLSDIVAVLKQRQPSQMPSNNSEQLLINERNVLTRRLEEARIELTEIKTTWSEKIASLVIQVERLSKQLAEESTERIKLSREMDKLLEQLKQNRFEIESYQLEVKTKESKIRCLTEEVAELTKEFQVLQDDYSDEIEVFRKKVVSDNYNS